MNQITMKLNADHLIMEALKDATEVSDASGMQLLDVPNRCWSDEVLEKLDINKALLPKVYESPEVTGVISEEAAKRTGLGLWMRLCTLMYSLRKEYSS